MSSTSGLGKDCAIHIAYNSQFSLCTPKSPEGAKCRSASNLCTADPDFAFDLSAVSTVSPPLCLRLMISLTLSCSSFGPQTTAVLPLSSLLPDIQSPALSLFDTTFKPSLPLPLRLGDINMDGFPDVLLVVSTSSGTQAKILESVACGPQHKECQSGRTFRVPPRGTAALDAITDVKLASFIDVDDDVSLHASSLRLIRQ